MSKFFLADVVDGFVIDYESTAGMFQSGMGSQNGVVRFNDGGWDLGSEICSKVLWVVKVGL